LAERVLRAGRVLARPDTWLDGGGVLVARGRIVRVLRGPAAVRRAARGAPLTDLGDVLLAPGLVNAHAHLELSGLAGELPRGPNFAAWIARLLELRAARGARRLAADARRGAERCLDTGTTTVGDIDTTGAALRGLAGHALRVVHFREVLDAFDPARTAGALRGVARALARRARQTEGLAPHASFTASAALLGGVARLARRRSAPVTVHWSETPAEVEWLARGSGPLAALLGPSPRCSGLDLLERAGLLGPGLALVHGNHPRPGEPARLARAGVSLVHCPGSHAWFERAPAPLRRYRRAGVPLALGTDSLASNEDLDLRREMRLLREAQPWLAPEAIWAFATLGGARALGAAGELGELRPGARADLVAHAVGGNERRAALEALTSGAGRVAGVWVGGARRRS
jgi:cytosine/adenosine deaminase-related metal-dependent hydrolase